MNGDDIAVKVRDARMKLLAACCGEHQCGEQSPWDNSLKQASLSHQLLAKGRKLYG